MKNKSRRYWFDSNSGNWRFQGHYQNSGIKIRLKNIAQGHTFKLAGLKNISQAHSYKLSGLKNIAQAHSYKLSGLKNISYSRGWYLK